MKFKTLIRNAIWWGIIIIAIAGIVYAQDLQVIKDPGLTPDPGSPSSSTEDNSITLVTDPAGLVPNDVFPDLVDNTYRCFPNCSATFDFINRMDGETTGDTITFLFQDLEGNDVSDKISEYTATVNDTPLADYTFSPGEQATIKLTGVKSEDIDMDWKPQITLTAISVGGMGRRSPDSVVMPVSIVQDQWALWRKGAESNNSIAGMAGGYNLDENTGTTTQDFVSGGNANLVGTNNYWNSKGIYGACINVSGLPAGYRGVDLGNSAALRPTGANALLSVDTWVMETKHAAGALNQVVGGNISQDGNDIGYGLWLLNSHFQFAVRNVTGGSCLLDSGVTNPVGSWTNFIATYNSTSCNQTIYLNGTLIASQVCCLGGGIRYRSSHVFLGMATPNSDDNSMLIDATVIFNNTILSGTDAQNIYQSAIVDSNITYPLNASTITMSAPTSTLNNTALIGFGDKTLANITYTNTTGNVLVLKNASGEYNYSGTYLTRLNATHYSFTATVVYPPGSYNWSIQSWGGNGLITSSNQNVFFTLTNPPPTINYVVPYDDSGTYYSRNYIYTDIAASDTDLKNLSVTLAECTGLKANCDVGITPYSNTTIWTTASLITYNFTGLSGSSVGFDGYYIVWGWVNDSVNQIATTTPLSIYLNSATTTTTSTTTTNTVTTVTTSTTTSTLSSEGYTNHFKNLVSGDWKSMYGGIYTQGIGYWAYFILIAGFSLALYLQYQSIAGASIVYLVILGLCNSVLVGSMGGFYYGAILFGVASLIYGLLFE